MAFYRLAARLKERFPRLPIGLALDGLYAAGPVFQICRDHHWKIVITLKDESLPSVNAEFEALAQLQPENRLQFRYPDTRTTRQYRWSDDIAYRDTKGREHQLSVLELRQTVDRGEDGDKTARFNWVTNLNLNPRNAAIIADKGGRIRAKKSCPAASPPPETSPGSSSKPGETPSSPPTTTAEPKPKYSRSASIPPDPRPVPSRPPKSQPTPPPSNGTAPSFTIASLTHSRTSTVSLRT